MANNESNSRYQSDNIFSAYCKKKDIKGIFYISKLFIDNKILENVNNKWILLFMSAIIMCCIS